MSRPPRLRAPREDRAIVAEPPLAEAGRLIAANRQRLTEPPLNILGRPWAELRRSARQSTLSAARDYLREAGEPIPVSDDSSLLLSGHQPELFHPGVWVKNFALNRMARAHGASVVNLVVDNDTAKVTALHVPAPAAVESDWPHALTVPYDTSSGEVPYEERLVRDEALFASLPERVAALVGSWSFEPLLPSFWKEVRGQAQRTALLGERLVAGRRSMERAWGCHNLEVPVSLLCQTEPFAWFACHLLTHLPRFHAIYNACVRDYRRQYGIRSRNHPVPDLVGDDGWLEAPFWAWRAGQTRRGRLLARHANDSVELRVGNETWPPLPRKSPDMIQAWLDLERHGLKVRSRALTNTLFARLFVADLFVHGIGGGKYDELTDAIIRRYYGMEPPGFMVLSATLRLPLPAYPVRPEDCHELARLARDLRYNPQRHVPAGARSNPQIMELVTRKQAWAERRPTTPPERRERFQELRRVTEQIRPFLAGEEESVRRSSVRCEQQLQANAVLHRRDYAFCLYPESELRAFCTQFL